MKCVTTQFVLTLDDVVLLGSFRITEDVAAVEVVQRKAQVAKGVRC